MSNSSGSQNKSASDDRSRESYEELVAAALRATFSGWNFGYLNGRVRGCDLPWSYEDLARAEISDSSRVLDLDTGGGEVLCDIVGDRRPSHVVATESWSPNIPVARKRLEPLGISVRPSRDGDPLPAADGEFTLALNRHGSCDLTELGRVLGQGGTYLVQSVGRFNDVEFNTALAGPAPGYRDTATLEHDGADLGRCGFEIIDSGEAFCEFAFLDIGAVVFHLKAVSWQVPGFDVDVYDRALRRLDTQIRKNGQFTVRHHRYFIKAARP